MSYGTGRLYRVLQIGSHIGAVVIRKASRGGISKAVIVDYQKIAEEYAHKGGHDIVTHCASKNGYEYFRLNYSERPKYLGLPLVIKIDVNGKIQIVTELNIIFWAVNQSKNGER